MGVTGFGADGAGATGVSFGAGFAISGSLAWEETATGDFAVSPESGPSFGGDVWSVGFAATDGFAGAPPAAGSAPWDCATSLVAGWVAGCVSGGAGFAVGSTGTTGAAAAAESGGGTGGGLTGAFVLTVGLRMNPDQG